MTLARSWFAFELVYFYVRSQISRNSVITLYRQHAQRGALLTGRMV